LLGWHNRPSLEWLLSGTWHHVPSLRDSYDTVEDYTRTLLHVWTLLTFYWGSGAMWARCTHRRASPGAGADAGSPGAAQICGEPLLDGQLSTASACTKCGAPAVWQCHRRSKDHDRICASCLRKRQAQLIGAPGQHASTDVYDATVERETTRREGVVYLLKALHSRKPPLIECNWRTTYRLKTAALVALVHLSRSQEPLTRTHALSWAEVVPGDVKDPDNDWQQRKAGKIAVRMLSLGEAPAEALLEPGSCVAIIDLRVFVPEVITVLTTLAHPSFLAHMSLIPFASQLLGLHAPDIPRVRYDSQAQLGRNVLAAVEGSNIPIVRRLDNKGRIELAGRICRLNPVQSLVGTQLEAFCASLTLSAHCCQGPPGTGKVCLPFACCMSHPF
jgi:hypothetical protein